MKFNKFLLSGIFIALLSSNVSAEQRVTAKPFLDVNNDKQSLRSSGSLENSINMILDGEKVLIISAYTPNAGEEPWVVTESNTVRPLADINDGTLPSHPQKFSKIGNQVFFSAVNNETGTELYSIQGDPATAVLHDVNLEGSSNPDRFTSYDGWMYFVADDGIHGRELWRTKGGTPNRITDINPNGDSRINHLTPFGDWMYFTASDGTNGNELYRTNGETTELFKEFYPGAESGVKFGSKIFVYEDKLYVNAYFSEQVGYEIHVVDANHSTPSIFFEFAPGAENIDHVSDALAAEDGYLYLILRKGFNRELWSYNNEGQPTFVSSQSSVSFLCDFDNHVFFRSNFFGNNGLELYKMSNGVVKLLTGVDGEPFELNAGEASSNPQKCINDGQAAYFVAETTLNGKELLKVQAGSFFAEIAHQSIEGLSYENVKVLGKTGTDIFVTQGTNNRVGMFDKDQSEIIWSSNNQPTGVDSSLNVFSPHKAVAFKDKLYFSAYTEESGHELWVSDHDDATLAMDIFEGKGSSYPNNFFVYNERLYFTAITLTEGRELWVVNDDSIELVADVFPGITSSSPAHFAILNDLLYFSANISGKGREIVVTDGQDFSLKTDINIDEESSGPKYLTVYKDKLWFQASDGTNGFELWSLDSEDNLIMHNLDGGPASTFPSNFHVVGDYLYFEASDENGNEMWGTDGEITLQLKDINPGADGSIPREFVSDENTLYFIANTGNVARAWRTTGLNASELNASEIENFRSLEMVDGRLFALASNAAEGIELWRRQGNDFTMVDTLTDGPNVDGANEAISLSSAHNTLFALATDGYYYLNKLNHAEFEWLPLGFDDMHFERIGLNNITSSKLLEFGKSAIVKGCNDLIGCEFIKLFVNSLPNSFVTGPASAHSGSQVEFDASLSSDDDGEIIGFVWSQIEGPSTDIVGTDQAIMSFVAPNLVGEELLKFQVDITDNDGDVTSYVKWLNVFNESPMAIINVSNSNPESGQNVILDGSASTDDTMVSTFVWSQISGPAISLTNANQSVANFTVPELEADAGVVLMLTVTDENTITHSQTVVIHMEPAKAENQAPNALISVSNLSPESGSLVTLDGAASNDPDGSITQYEWHQLNGIAISLGNNDQVATSFIAPEVTEPTIVTIQLSVVDDAETSSQASVQIQVMPADEENQAPNAVIEVSNHNPVAEELVTLNASASSDTDGAIVSFVWQQVAGPQLVLNGSETAEASFITPAVNDDDLLQFKLIITDDQGAVTVSNVFINLEAVANQSPTANITVNNLNPVSGTGVSLNGTSSLDPDGEIVSYQWIQTAGPQVSLNNANKQVATFIAPIVNQDTLISFKLTVTDNDGAIAEKEISLTVEPQLVPNNGQGNGGGSTNVLLLLALMVVCMGRRRF